MNSLIALVNALTAPVSLSALKSVLLAMVGNQQEFTFDVTIPSSDVLTLNSPYDLVPAQGANTIIVPTIIQTQMIYGTTPYATNGTLQIYCGGNKEVASATANGFLFGTVSRIVNVQLPQPSSSATDTQYVANSPLTVTVASGNPTAGDSDIRIFGTYKVIDIS
jgi:hypothetical protein